MYVVCTNETFNNFVEACIREIICNFPVEDDIFRKYTPPILSELVYFKWISNNPGKNYYQMISTGLTQLFQLVKQSKIYLKNMLLKS